MNVREKVYGDFDRIIEYGVIRDRRFLDDEQLVRSEQLAVLEEIFSDNVRDSEIREITCHFAPIFRADHPMHLALWGKTGTGKTLTMIYFLGLVADRCRERSIPLRFVHLDLSTARPCFRALNDLACLLNASKRYSKGIALEELMNRIEASLRRFKGYLVIFVDEVDNVRRDRDSFLAFLVRRLPQRIPCKLILVFASNRLSWTDHLDPRVRSFLKLNELIFKPYDAMDLQRILAIRVEKALYPDAIEPGVIEKIAGLSSRDHGDARQAVALLARSAHIAQKTGKQITLDTVDEAAECIEHDRYLTMIRTAPVQMQAALAAAIELGKMECKFVNTGEVHQAYRAFCGRADIKPMAARAFGDLITELEMYSFLRTTITSKGRYGRTREISVDLPDDLQQRIYETILLNFRLHPTTKRRTQQMRLQSMQSP